jgi:hypothetical protein
VHRAVDFFYGAPWLKLEHSDPPEVRTSCAHSEEPQGRASIYTSAHEAATDDHNPVRSHRHRYQKAAEALAKRSRRSKSFLAAEAIAAFVEAEG